MGKESPSLKQTVSAAGSGATLRIHFPETTVSEPGTNVSIPASTPTPRLSIPAAALASAAPAEGGTTTTTKKYLVFAIDLDAPFPSFSVMSPILHGMHVDLVAGAAASADADGFVPLESASSSSSSGSDDDADWLVPWAAPGPPKPSAPHRYVFMAFEQPEGLDAGKIRTLLGFGPAVGLLPRIRWDQQAAEAKLGLGAVLAGNYFLTRR